MHHSLLVWVLLRFGVPPLDCYPMPSMHGHDIYCAHIIYLFHSQPLLILRISDIFENILK